MTELEKMQRAKMYIDKLANGIDPVSDELIGDQEVVNQVQIARCLFYVSGVLEDVIENKQQRLDKRASDARKLFSSPQEKRKKIEFSTQAVDYLNELSDDGNGVSLFFNDERWNRIILENLYAGQIQIYEYSDLLPIKDHHDSYTGDLGLSERRKIFLEHFDSKRKDVRKIWEAVLEFLNPYLTKLELCADDLLVDHASRSAFLIGAFHVSRLYRFVLSSLFDKIEHIYVFPYINGEPNSEIPFHQDVYLELVITPEAKESIEKAHSDYMAKEMSKMNGIAGDRHQYKNPH